MKKQRTPFTIADFFRSFRSYRSFRRLSPDRRNIVFYSESGQDWHVFKRIIEKLLSMSKTVCYVTSDRQDEGLTLSHPGYDAFFIQEGFWQICFFQFLKADCMVLTMIDLGIFHLKKSISPVHYIYLFHSMSSTHMVDFENSYDHYDTILCVGPHQVHEIRGRERLNNLPPKNLVEHGYARVEELMREAEKRRRVPTRPFTLLLAPTWGNSSILNVCGKELVGVLLGAGYRVILRPHYRTRKLTPHVIDAIIAIYGNNPLLTHVDRMGDMESLFDSDLLLCDWSSTSIEYALGLEKPVLYIDVPRRVRNGRYGELGLEPLEVSIRREVGMVLAPGELDKAPAMIDLLLSNPGRFSDRIAALRNKVLFNINQSVEAGAGAIASIADTLMEKRR
ncbi:MAG: CDP-glycerol glycerophosphotransferase family protein [Chitinispirillaceae bacterium]|nr:CDP-glycerol glycerophosphotransferase family protein [Chitinispirillaceae bacterium]